MDNLILNIQVGEKTYPFPLQNHSNLEVLARGAHGQFVAEYDKGQLRTPQHEPYVKDLITFYSQASVIAATRGEPTIKLDHLESLGLIATGAGRLIETSARDSQPLDTSVTADLLSFSSLAQGIIDQAFNRPPEMKG